MASLPPDRFGHSWFSRPPNPLPANPNFCWISTNWFKKNEPPQKPLVANNRYKEKLERFLWEQENLPDYRHAPEVEEILHEDSVFDKKELTPEEKADNEKWWDKFEKSPVVKFLVRAEEIADAVNEMELKENSVPFRKEDHDLWKALPNVPGLDGRPMPRKAIKTEKEAHDKFWDFCKQFLFGLWGFRQRPYPPGRPIDVAQAFGYKRLEKRYYDFIMRSGGFYYKDRLGRTRGPCELIQLKTSWAAGIIDTNTFIWGEDMDEWAPIGMVYGLQPAIATWEVRLGAAATAALHKMGKGIPPWVPLKGFEKKSYKQLQDEAIESKRRDLAVLEANGGVWPGERIPSHALFLWASGSELTTILEEDHMPNKFIPKDLRKRLQEIIPGLRPWEVLSIEQAMDQITYDGGWYREPLGSYTTGPPYIRHWNRDVKRMFRLFHNLTNRVYQKLDRVIPGFKVIMDRVQQDVNEKDKRREEKQSQKKRGFEEIIEKGISDVPIS
ncbi:hypothetical protein AMTRI_Chr05g60140 [Amborella trichopoda]|uniref:GYF domain-containing protein n=1 Tax=Amborella trichopoda TaxID=13333 RepID=U5CYQ1_AMBTC|nr:protein TIC 56, chloroplastic [Amborella trichopoda]ERN15304.1 hypothetical protein AMTR_s00036p00064050 [Amborella trichopoda]|eukprot:XP_006853837.1 protein TIC 56, chloroplastic [Amborella trichopoda]